MRGPGVAKEAPPAEEITEPVPVAGKVVIAGSMKAQPPAASFHVAFEACLLFGRGGRHIRHNNHIILRQVPFPEEGGVCLEDPAVSHREFVKETDGLVGKLPVGLLDSVRVLEESLDTGRIPGVAGRTDRRGGDKGLPCLVAAGVQQ